MELFRGLWFNMHLRWLEHRTAIRLALRLDQTRVFGDITIPIWTSQSTERHTIPGGCCEGVQLYTVGASHAVKTVLVDCWASSTAHRQCS
jgi:hypothetical protein